MAWVGVGFCLGGLLLGIRAVQAWRRRSVDVLLERTPLREVASATGGPVKVRGTVVATELGLVREPVQDAEAVWYRATAHAKTSEGSHNAPAAWEQLHTEHDGRDFGVDDGSGALVRVPVAEAGFLVPRDQFGGTEEIQVLGGALPSAFHRLTRPIEAWALSRSGRSTAKAIKVERWMLAPATAVTVLGVLDRAESGATLRPLRETGEVVVSSVPEEVVGAAARGDRLRNTIFLAGAGAVSIGVGVLMVL